MTAGSTDGSHPGDTESTTTGGALPGAAASPPMQWRLLQQMRNQQEAHDVAMQQQAATRKEQDLQFQQLTGQISALRAEASTSREEKAEATSSTTTTGMLSSKSSRNFPYAEAPEFPIRPAHPVPERALRLEMQGHNKKMGVHGMLCNRGYTMIGYQALLEGDNKANGRPDAVRAKLAFMEQKIFEH
ncbi:hypothetical protein CYMTET_2809 [Cymbomonas tetramitiformis]|uniref:Uncharacterized protein n=1 Tax=Cymbomonas tetramitiformis TaxID=36881 RepID=A0AAE0LM65_9CHLO|nr:hypothetical protein CYMTET_2809 [Cymbomonas tetramitiformis]